MVSEIVMAGIWHCTGGTVHPPSSDPDHRDPWWDTTTEEFRRRDTWWDWFLRMVLTPPERRWRCECCAQCRKGGCHAAAPGPRESAGAEPEGGGDTVGRGRGEEITIERIPIGRDPERVATEEEMEDDVIIPVDLSASSPWTSSQDVEEGSVGTGIVRKAPKPGSLSEPGTMEHRARGSMYPIAEPERRPPDPRVLRSESGRAHGDKATSTPAEESDSWDWDDTF